MYIYICIYIHIFIFIYIWQLPLETPWAQIFDFLVLIVEKSNITFSASLTQSPRTKRFVFGSKFV